jgi:hypothetical protein
MPPQDRQRRFLECSHHARPRVGLRAAVGARRCIQIGEVQRDLVDGRLWQVDCCFRGVLANQRPPVG